MPIRWKVRKHRNPQNNETLYFPTSSQRTQVNFDTLAAEIEKLTSLTAGDALNMLRTMQYLVIQHLQNSDTVRFDQLGTFYATLKTNGQGKATAKEVSADDILGVRVRFITGGGLRRGLDRTNLELWKTKLDWESSDDDTSA